MRRALSAVRRSGAPRREDKRRVDDRLHEVRNGSDQPVVAPGVVTEAKREHNLELLGTFAEHLSVVQEEADEVAARAWPRRPRPDAGRDETQGGGLAGL